MKHTLFTLAKRVGVTDMVRDSAWRRARLLVLCYHGISQLDEHEWNPSLFMPSQVFRQRMLLLKDGGYNVLPLGRALQQLRAGTLPPRSVAITFDDGTVDFSELAVPILTEFGFPATVYLTTYYSDHRLPIFDTALSYILWHGRERDADFTQIIGERGPHSLRSELERQSAWDLVQRHASARGLAAEDKDRLLRAIARLLGADYFGMVERQIMHIMPPNIVRALPRDLIDVQLHTHRHRTPRDHSEFKREILDNRIRLRAVAGEMAEYVHFCYPSGDYDGRFLTWLHELDVVSATTCIPGVANRNSHPLLVPRFVDTTTQSAATFEAWVSGVAALLPARRAHRIDPDRLR